MKIQFPENRQEISRSFRLVDGNFRKHLPGKTQILDVIAGQKIARIFTKQQDTGNGRNIQRKIEKSKSCQLLFYRPMIPLKNVLVDNGLPVLVKNRQRQIRQRSPPYGADIKARDPGNTFFGENTLLMIAGDRFSWTHPNPDLSLVTDWREVGRMNFHHGDIPPPSSPTEYTSMDGSGKMLPSDRKAPKFCRSLSVTFIPDGRPFPSTPIRRKPGLRLFEKSLAKAQTAWEKLSVLSSVLSVAVVNFSLSDSLTMRREFS